MSGSIGVAVYSQLWIQLDFLGMKIICELLQPGRTLNSPVYLIYYALQELQEYKKTTRLMALEKD